ncbi:hypothetical protein CBR_g41809 [Chara braunii]|uniref:Uncharacterized protein n=1 Tax=Chara braunii TaxID=69332 RepID=A0A388LWP2_CHABU|nr:hypothetical protein CBR_g41809 [Chara braunii]|eukprot:GBG86744.1 hypothetical protein CBR_g41809 [Chara braunii]
MYAWLSVCQASCRDDQVEHMVAGRSIAQGYKASGSRQVVGDGDGEVQWREVLPHAKLCLGSYIRVDVPGCVYQASWR